MRNSVVNRVTPSSPDTCFESAETPDDSCRLASTWRQHLSLIGHFCSSSSQRRSLHSSSFVHWLPHYSCNPCSTSSLARHSVWHKVSMHVCSRHVIGWEGERQPTRRKSNGTETPELPFSVRQVPLPPALEGVAWLILRHILSGKSSSGRGSGLGYCLWEELSITQGGSNLLSSTASLGTFSFQTPHFSAHCQVPWKKTSDSILDIEPEVN